MRKFLVAGNWKMNLTRHQAVELLVQLRGTVADIKQDVDILVCPSYVYLELAQHEIKSSNIKLGAQNVAATPQGAFTGEISMSMLREFGCEYVIIGHSERRTLLGETDTQIAQKFSLVKEAGMTPILCVGEPVESDDGFAVVAKQLHAVVHQVGMATLRDTVIAYEPVWAIGTGKTASAQHIAKMHHKIRELLAVPARIIYGGSVKSDNVAEIFQQPDVDGALIGGAALKAQEFSDICHIAMSIAK